MHQQSNFPPIFWDNLSKVWLTPSSLRELNRRNVPEISSRASYDTAMALPNHPARLARRGGPNLDHVRGYFPEVNITANLADLFSDSTPRGLLTQFAGDDRVASSYDRCFAYDMQFQQHLADHGVYMNNKRSTPANIESIHLHLANHRESPSLIESSRDIFAGFQREIDEVAYKSDVMAIIFPVLYGGSTVPYMHSTIFTELLPLTTGDTVTPEPDYFDGALVTNIRKDVRDCKLLKSTILPTKGLDISATPNFFFQGNGPSGCSNVAQRKMCYYGAYGARAMHCLQNYGNAKPIYDGNAYTFSSTYHDGLITLYAHHVTAPTTEGGRPEYHMTKIQRYDLIDCHDRFVQGVVAFRNARDLAKHHRDDFIKRANTKATENGADVPMWEAPEHGVWSKEADHVDRKRTWQLLGLTTGSEEEHLSRPQSRPRME